MGKQDTNQNDNSVTVKVTRKVKTTTSSTSTKTKNRQTNPDTLKLPTVRKVHFKLSHIILAIVLIILAVFFGRVAIWEHDYLNRMEGSEREEPVNPAGEIVATEHADRKPPLTNEDRALYTVAPDKPRYFSIPSLGIDRDLVFEVGILADGEMATPQAPDDAVGWYTGSSLPGAAGVSVMNGHGGVPGGCTFGDLPQIKAGDTIQIEMGDGREYTYRVVDIATKALGEEANSYMQNEAFQSPVPGQPSLTLITCVGDYLLSGKTYSHRLFVRAVLES